MIPGQFEYLRPGSLDEALRILRDREGEAKILSGGYSLIPLIKLRLAQPALLVDIQAITGLDGITEDAAGLHIGSRATHRQIHENELVVDHYPLLHDVSGGIGDPQVRNWGTIGGSVAHADPASDWPAALLAVNATVVCRGAAGDREVAARDFFLDTFTTAIEPTEVLVEIRFGIRPRLFGGAYTKLERRVGDFATAGVAAIVQLGPDGTITRAGIGVTGVSASPFAAVEAEATLAGKQAGDEPYRAAGAAAAAASEPASDVRGSADYKRAMVAELTLRSLRTAAERARAYA
jgi:carbon-monoxide dehydrogenase medium subunit